MAKQVEGFLVGTYDDITFYKMEGQYYARMKSSLTGKKFWKHKAFEGSRRSCNRFGRGNQLASIVYNEIPESRREYVLFCKMKSVAIALIKAGNTEEEVINGLRMMKPIVRRKIVRRKIKIRQFDNSTMRKNLTIRQFDNSAMGKGSNLKMRGFENLKMGRRERRKLTSLQVDKLIKEGVNLRMMGFEDLKMSINRRGRRGRGGGVFWRFGNLRI